MSQLQHLPNWAHWMAKDEDGQCWVYEAEPHQHHCGWYENEVGRVAKVSCLPELRELHWQDSLTQLKVS